MEEYKLIKDFQNYEVSNHGNVRNKTTGKIRVGQVNIDGYNILGLCKNKKQTIVKVHRLVATAFIDNPQNKPQVDHIDNNKKNNTWINLRWCTHAENQHNTAIQKNNVAGVKGVRFMKNCQKWQARITIDGIRVHIGSFDNIEDATRARMKKANEIFGEFVNDCEKLPKIKLKSTVKLFKTINDLFNEVNQLIHL